MSFPSQWAHKGVTPALCHWQCITAAMTMIKSTKMAKNKVRTAKFKRLLVGEKLLRPCYMLDIYM